MIQFADRPFDQKDVFNQLHATHVKFYNQPDTSHGSYDYDVPIISVNRDSGLIERSNFAFIKRSLESLVPDNICVGRYLHWACGWVEYVFLNLENIQDHPVLKWLYETSQTEQEYMILDEDSWSQMCYDETLDAIKDYEPTLNQRAPKDRLYRARKVFARFPNIEITDNGDLQGVSSKDILDLYIKLRWANRGDQ